MTGLAGALGATRVARVDGRGGVSVPGTDRAWSWWVGAEDRWHRAESEPAVRGHRPGPAPVHETSMRVPSGDVIERVYAIGGPGDPVVIELENASPLPVALALVGRGSAGGVELLASKPATHVVRADDADALLSALERGDPGGPVTDDGRAGEQGVVATLTPLSHRTRVRFAISLDPRSLPDPFDLVGAPSADEVTRGWETVLRRGMRVVLADDHDQEQVDRDRVDLVLEAAGADPSADLFRALEDWGFDDEAIGVWRRLGWRSRRRAGRRSAAPPATADPVGRLLRRRAALVADGADGAVTLLPQAPGPGAALEVHDAPTRAGRVSFALRWHGERVALLWDVAGVAGAVRLAAPGLDPDWSTDAPAGEVLLEPDAVSATGA